MTTFGSKTKLNPKQMPPGLQDLLDHEAVVKLSRGVSLLIRMRRARLTRLQSKNLHILLHTLRQWLTTHPLPPMSPTLPDMHSSTSSYIALQNLFKAAHQSELTEFRSLLEGVLGNISLPADAISNEEIESFVKGTGFVAIIKGSPLREGREGNERLQEALGMSSRPEW